MMIEVNDANRRRAASADPPRQRQQPVRSFDGIAEALERRRGRREHDRHVERLRPDDCEIPARVAKARLLLIGRIVLLVDNDEPGSGQGREHSGSRADDQPGLA